MVSRRDSLTVTQRAALADARTLGSIHVKGHGRFAPGSDDRGHYSYRTIAALVGARPVEHAHGNTYVPTDR